MLQWGTSYLAEKGIGESRLTVELLLSHVLQLKRIELYTKFDRPLSEDELSSFKLAFKRRLKHEPIQYIIGTTEFMGLEFQVDKRVLIPRPETEILVEQAVRYARERFSGQPIRILDAGTGSGCIAVSLAKMIQGSTVLAVDISPGALEVAESNASKNGVQTQIRFEERDILRTGQKDFPAAFHLVLSNPPYISASEIAALPPEVREFEPGYAVGDGGDGYTFYRHFAGVARSWLDEGGALMMEVAYNQGDGVRHIFAKEGWRDVRVEKDYDGNPRCLMAFPAEGHS